jgi:hypothetical protein
VNDGLKLSTTGKITGCFQYFTFLSSLLYDTTLLRDHFRICIDSGKLTPFPTRPAPFTQELEERKYNMRKYFDIVEEQNTRLIV